MKVIWSNKALGQLQAIYGYIAENSPPYATNMIERLHARVGQLEAFPDSGRPVPEDQGGGAREVFAHPYRLISSTKFMVLKSRSWRSSTCGKKVPGSFGPPNQRL